jgi:hypothetical protein
MSPALYEASSPFLMIESLECVNEKETHAKIYRCALTLSRQSAYAGCMSSFRKPFWCALFPSEPLRRFLKRPLPCLSAWADRCNLFYPPLRVKLVMLKGSCPLTYAGSHPIPRSFHIEPAIVQKRLFSAPQPLKIQDSFFPGEERAAFPHLPGSLSVIAPSLSSSPFHKYSNPKSVVDCDGLHL